MELPTEYEALPGQKRFHESPKRFRAYVGGFGSGKTFCGCMEALMLLHEYPRNFGLIGAQTYPQLTDTTQRTFFELIDKYFGYNRIVRSYSKTERHLYLRNGSEAIFRTLDDPGKLKSLNLGFFYIDEASEVPESTFMMLQGRLRLDRVKRHTGFVTTNSEGHNWIWRLFLKKSGNDYDLIVAPTTENTYLPPTYIDSLRNNYPKDWVDRYVYASFNIFQGIIWKTWDDRIHVVKDFNPPRKWNRGISIDYGLRNPTAVGFYAVDPAGNVIKYDEYHEEEMLVSVHAKNIKTKWQMEFRDKPLPHHNIWIDPSSKQREGISGQSILAEFSDNGIYASPANNDVRAGILKVGEYLKLRKDWERPSWADPVKEDYWKLIKKNGSPMLYVCERCRHTRAEIEDYQWKKLGTKLVERQDPKEQPRKKDDHHCDETRYFCISLPDPAEIKKKTKIPVTQTQRVWHELKNLKKKVDPIDIPPYAIMTPEQKGLVEAYDGLD